MKTGRVGPYQRRGRGYYGDFRGVGGGREALTSPGSRNATHDSNEAIELYVARRKFYRNRTEGIVENFESGHGYFEGWTREDFFARTESPHSGGRAIAMLAADPDVTSKSGRVLGAHEIAREYDFTDVDGRQPVPVH